MASSRENSVWVSIGLTKNLGNYESLRIDAGGSAAVEDGEDRAEVYKRLWDDVKDQIERKLAE